MYEGKPLLLVIGGSDTGRTPIAGALLRHTLNGSAIVLTAGVLSHAGESAAPEAKLALEQLGIDISWHVSRPIDDSEHHQAELLLAVDRGTEMVLFTRFPNDPRIACLSTLAEAPDVLDPHRMPLGVWISVVHQIREQITKALPKLRQELGIGEQEPVEMPEPRSFTPLTTGGQRWDDDENMQRLIRLINDGQNVELEAVGEPEANGAAQTLPTQPAQTEAIQVTAQQSDPPAQDRDEMPGESQTEAPATAAPGRADQVARLLRMLEVAGEVPEIIDWQRLRQELIDRLRAIAQQTAGATDFAPAAALMIEGKLVQQAALPAAEALFLLGRSIRRLDAPIDATGLAAIGGELAQW